MNEAKLRELNDQVYFRESQFGMLNDLLIKNDCFLYPIIHLFGLSGTGKTYAVKKFMNKFCDNDSQQQLICNENINKYSIYLNCSELCYSSISVLFNEIITQIKTILNGQDKELGLINNNKQNIDLNNSIDFDLEDDTNDIKMADCSLFIRQLNKYLNKFLNRTCLYFIFDNADNLKSYNEVSNLLLTLFKINEYTNLGESNNKVIICNLLISEIDWHSLLSEFDLMSKTEAPRPFIIYFNDYTKEQMYLIIKKTAKNLVKIQEEYNSSIGEDFKNLSQYFDIEFYARIILDVFYPICKDLNEIQYLVQIYYDELISSTIAETSVLKNNETLDSQKRMISKWNRMKPFLKNALTQIYLRQSMFNSSNEKSLNSNEELISKCFESLNLVNDNEKTASNIPPVSTHLPKLMKFLLISAYISTHNPVKYDKKLFDYNAIHKNSRKSKFTAQKIQQNEDNQRAAALKTQSFDFNRLLAIFFAICADNGYTDTINLDVIERNIKTLKSLHYLQQTNSSYSSLDEPKFKCLLDFDTISNISSSIGFNIKQYLAEYITI
jgi:Cdc6-like AAA superfamily ATPase